MIDKEAIYCIFGNVVPLLELVVYQKGERDMWTPLAAAWSLSTLVHVCPLSWL